MQSHVGTTTPLGQINAFFIYGARDLVSFSHWPLKEAYRLYLDTKRVHAAGRTWDPEHRKLNVYLRGSFNGDDPRIREMRRAAGRDVNDSDLPYDSEEDASDGDSDF